MNMDTKRRRVSKNKNDDADFHVSLSINSKFSKFPAELRNTVELMLTNMIETLLNRSFAQPAADLPHAFVIKAKIKHSADHILTNSNIIKQDLQDALQANTLLLEHFMKEYSAIVHSSSFLQLQNKSGRANPSFSNLHAAHYGEVGWGFDCNKCLSLYLASEDVNGKKESIYFVEQIDAKNKVKDERT